jgi:Ca-activated chloride channel family protein
MTYASILGVFTGSLMIRTITGIGILILVRTLGAHAQNAEDFTLQVDVPVVSVDVSVTDANGRPVAGLTRNDFEILENGAPQPVSYFGPSTAPYHTYLLVDVSGSTQNSWDFMHQAISGFVSSLAPHDRVSVGVFGHTLVTLSGWDAPQSHAASVLAPILDLDPVGGTTEFYRSLEDVLEDEFDDISERKAIIVLTDGRDISLYQELTRQNRLLDMDDDRRFMSLYRRVAESGVAVYFVAVNTDQNLAINGAGADEYLNLGIIFGDSPLPERYLEQVRLRMEKLAEISGGRVVFPRSIADVVEPFEEIAASLSGAYSLGYAPPEDNGETLRRITVRLPGLPHVVRQSRTEYRYSR